MRKPHITFFKSFEARLTEINKSLLIFPGSDATKNIPTDAVPNGCSKQFYLQLWYSEMNLYRETCAMFKRMEIDEQVYEGKSLSKKITGQMSTVTFIS